MKVVNLNQLMTGDTLAYRGGSSIVSKLIRFGSDSEYSHVLSYVGKVYEVLSVVNDIISGCICDSDMTSKLKKIRKDIEGRNTNDSVFIESDFSSSKLFKKYFKDPLIVSIK